MRSAFVCFFLLVASMAMAVAAAKPCSLQQGLSQAAPHAVALTAELPGDVVSGAPICSNPLGVAVTQEDRSEMIPVPPARAVVATHRFDLPHCTFDGVLADRHEPLLRPPSRA